MKMLWYWICVSVLKRTSLSAVLNQMDRGIDTSILVTLYNRLEQASAQSVNVCLANLDVNNDGLVDETQNSGGVEKRSPRCCLGAALKEFYRTAATPT
jgi:hypothetical protein